MRTGGAGCLQAAILQASSGTTLRQGALRGLQAHAIARLLRSFLVAGEQLASAGDGGEVFLWKPGSAPTAVFGADEEAPDPGWRISHSLRCSGTLRLQVDLGPAPKVARWGVPCAHHHQETQGAARREPHLCGIIGAPAEIQLQHGMACTVRLGVTVVTERLRAVREECMHVQGRARRGCQ